MNRFCSIFSQLLQSFPFFPRWEFQQLVLETEAERHARGFGCWAQFVAMRELIPELYGHGLAQGDLELALRGLLARISHHFPWRGGGEWRGCKARDESPRPLLES